MRRICDAVSRKGLQRLGGSPQDFVRQIMADRAKRGEVIRAHNIRAE